jgi:hypothetical protein
MKDLLIKIPQYLALFFVSTYVLGLAVFLARFFAMTTWAEYGYGIIAVALTGVAFSGVCLSLFANFFQRHRPAILFWLPFVLLFVSALAFQLICLNRFNPLLLQQDGLWPGQVLNLCYYALALFPVFFLAGLYLGLSFLDLYEDIAQACACFFIGSAAGLLLVFTCESFIHPFHLLAVLLPVLALAVLGRLFVLRYSLFLISLILLLFITGFGMWRILDGNLARIPEYKALSSAMKVDENRMIGETPSPGGYYQILDNFTERRNIDLSNQYGFPKVHGRPPAWGLYRDGDRVTGLYKEGIKDLSYFYASLDAFPYRLKPKGTYLLIGTDGGFKIHEIWGEKRTIHAVEPTRTIYDLVRKSTAGMAGISLSGNSPLAVLEPQGFDLIDMGSAFLREGDANRYAVTIEAISRYYIALKDDGILSLPVGTAGFSGYAEKLLATVNASLRRSRVDDPGRHILVYRSALGARILVSRNVFPDGAIASLQAFCRERDFDTSWYPGIETHKNKVLHDLSARSWTDRHNPQAEPADTLRDAALTIFRTPGNIAPDPVFNLEPATLDRPYFYAIFPVSKIGALLGQLSTIPRSEIGLLVNPTVLLLALILGAFVIFLPTIRKKEAVQVCSRPRMVIYFACLGLGFVLITMALIERCAYFLNDTTTAVAVVFFAMLFFSGCGSYRTSMLDPFSDRGIKWAVVRVITCLILYIFILTPVLSVLIPLSPLIKITTMLIVIAPVAFTIGLTFPLGLACLREQTGFFLPWAFGIYGIFCVIAFPLANLIAVAWGVHVHLFVAVFLYFIALWSYPSMGQGPAGKGLTS